MYEPPKNVKYTCKNGTVDIDGKDGKFTVAVTLNTGETKKWHNSLTMGTRRNLDSLGCDVATFDNDFRIRLCGDEDIPYKDAAARYRALKEPLEVRVAELKKRDDALYDEYMHADSSVKGIYDRINAKRKIIDDESKSFGNVLHGLEMSREITMGQTTMQVKGKKFKPSTVVMMVEEWLEQHPVKVEGVNNMVNTNQLMTCDVATARETMRHVASAFVSVLDYGPNPEKVIADDIPKTLDITRSQNVRRVHRAYSGR